MHFCVTMPQTLVPGIAERLVEDLRAGVEYAKKQAGNGSQKKCLVWDFGYGRRQQDGHRVNAGYV